MSTPSTQAPAGSPASPGAENRRAEPRARKRIKLLLGVGFSLAFAYLFARRLDFGRLGAELGEVEWRWLLVAQVTKGLGLLCMSLRARILLRPLGDYPIGRPFRAQLLGLVANNLLPFRAGELIRLDDLARAGGTERAAVLAVVVFERLMDMLAVLVLTAVAIPLVFAELPMSTSVAVASVGVCGALGVVLAIARWPDAFRRLADAIGERIGGRFGNALRMRGAAFVDGFASLRSGWALAGILVTTAGYWATGWLSVGLWGWAMGISMPWYGPGVILAIVALGAAIPSVPAQLGTYHLLAAYGVGLFGVAESRAAFALVGHATSFVPFTVLAFPLLILYFREFRWKVEPDSGSDPAP